MKLYLDSSDTHADLLQKIHEYLSEEKPALIHKADFLNQTECGGLFSAGCFERETEKIIMEADESAIKAGSYDLLVRKETGVRGYSSAYYALLKVLKKYLSYGQKTAAVLGEGSLSKCVYAVLNELGLTFEVFGTAKDIMETRAKKRFGYIINTTMDAYDPDQPGVCFDLNRFSSLSCVIDLNPLPFRTEMMLEAEDHGIPAYGGLEFIVTQAAIVRKIITGASFDQDAVNACMDEVYRKRRNIVLIGMPTSGKSTLSFLLGRITKREVTEMDEEAVRRLGMEISECFRLHGEGYFRALETKIAHDLYAAEGRIISCGGGVVKTPATMRFLQYNGIVVRLVRELAQLYASSDRPLSANNDDLKRLYHERMPLYQKYADENADNTGKIEDTLRQLMHFAREGELLPEMFGKEETVIVSKGKTKPVEIRVPSSKSLSQRALIAAALAEGVSTIHYCGHSEDINATMRALEKCGARFEEKGTHLRVYGIGRKTIRANGTIDCAESGTTLRFLIPLLALGDETVTFEGHGRLMQRPQSVYEEIFAKQELLFEKKDSLLRIKGPLRAGIYEVSGNISSQFISGLLFALALCEGDSEIRVQPPLESSSYIALTMHVLALAGIEIRQEGLCFHIKGGQKYHSFAYIVPGDDSQAAVFAALAMLKNVPVQVVNMDHASKQPDHAIVKIAEQFGARVHETESGYLFEPHELQAVNLSLGETPDLGPVLFALAAKARGTTVFTDTARLRMKESDRIASMEEELGRMGVAVRASENSFMVEGRDEIEGGITVSGHNDHRIVMALSVLASACEKPLRINGAHAINKSWPYFFYDLKEAGMDVFEIEKDDQKE